MRVCVIGAGPCGMLTLCAYKKLKSKGVDVEVTCYEKQDTPGGLWNFTWMTGIDQYGEPLHNSQYRDLFSNGPKECLEFPDYTFMDHFKKQIPSFPPRAVLLDYLQGYWKHCGVSSNDVLLAHCVRNVEFDDETNTFTVTVEDLALNKTVKGVFDYLVVATGHFSFPYTPSIKGFDNFMGRSLHAHDFRNSLEFVGQDVLFVGGSYSSEDISLQCLKFGAKSATISYKSKPISYQFPDYVKQRPQIDYVNSDGEVVFIDGNKQKFDSIVLCTGYLVKFPFLPSDITLRCGNVICPPNLYQGVQFVNETNSGNGRVLYLGMCDQWYTFTMFKMQAWWAASLTKGLLDDVNNIELKKKLESVKFWEEKAVNMNDDCLFQRDYINSLCEDLKCDDNLDTDKQFKEWCEFKHVDLVTYRDFGHESNFDNLGRAPKPNTPWFKNFDDSLKAFVDNI